MDEERKQKILEQMEHIKRREHYQKYLEKEKGKISKSKEIDNLKPNRIGVTLDGQDVYAPLHGPNFKHVAHIDRPVQMCSWCRSTFRFKGMTRKQIKLKDGTIHTVEHPTGIVDFDGKVYHYHCYYEMEAARGGRPNDRARDHSEEAAERRLESEHQPPRLPDGDKQELENGGGRIVLEAEQKDGEASSSDSAHTKMEGD